METQIRDIKLEVDNMMTSKVDMKPEGETIAIFKGDSRRKELNTSIYKVDMTPEVENIQDYKDVIRIFKADTNY